jgi:hypothetical protein
MLIQEVNMIAPCAALSEKSRCANVFAAAMRPRSATSSASRSPPGTPPAASMRADAALDAARAIRAWWMLITTQPTQSPPSTQMKEISVAMGRPLLWMMSDLGGWGRRLDS